MKTSITVVKNMKRKKIKREKTTIERAIKTLVWSQSKKLQLCAHRIKIRKVSKKTHTYQ